MLWSADEALSIRRRWHVTPTAERVHTKEIPGAGRATAFPFVSGIVADRAAGEEAILC